EPYRDRFTEGLDRDGAPDRYNRWTVKSWQEDDRLSDDTRAWMEARYDGEIAYLDDEIDRFVRTVDTLPGRTLIVFLSDHGEEFWEHGGYEHNHSLYDEVTRALLWMRPPGGRAGGAVVDTPASLADIVPTVLDALGVPPEDRPPLDGVSLAASDATAPASPVDRALPIGHLMFAPERWAVVKNQHKYILETGSGREELYDLRADPEERHDRSGRQDAGLPAWRTALSDATGFPVELGWRIILQGTREPFSLTFPKPFTDAWIIDPEALRSRRANLEWGEVPPLLAGDVATLEARDGGRTLVVTPGREARGVLAIAGPASQTRAHAAEMVVQPGRVVRLGGAPAVVEAGVLIRPTDTEAARLAHVQDPDAIDALRAMGYLEGAD
ncbi:MAG: sulfatase-like hydrolase/transferase, partial [Myxococcota bacterium]|nr:sulfatase-like hydrolase/transferase [Myxococcota bacterium]